jgi:hypothetical protein
MRAGDCCWAVWLVTTVLPLLAVVVANTLLLPAAASSQLTTLYVMAQPSLLSSLLRYYVELLMFKTGCLVGVSGLCC